MIYPIPPGLYCVPSALVALTGADYASVIFPAINRVAKADGLLDWVAGVRTDPHALCVLRELGYVARAPKDKAKHKLFYWAERSLKYPDRPFLIQVTGHVLVVENGKVYDTSTPHGVTGHQHPDAHSIVRNCWLIQKVS